MKQCKLKWLLLLAAAVISCSSCSRKLEAVTREQHDIVLTVLAGQSTSDAGVEDMIDEWVRDRYPEVRLEWECVDWGDSFDAQVRSRFAAGDVPDIIVGKAQDISAYVSTGNLAPISEHCSRLIEPEALSAVTADGIVYGLPVNAWYQGVIYNKALFRDCHVTVPKTEAEMEQVVFSLSQAGITPFASHFQETWAIGNTTMQFMMNEIFCDTPDWGDQLRCGKVNFADSTAIHRCMLNNQTILNHSWEDALSIDQYESDNRFANGKAAMYLTGSWSLQFAGQYASQEQFGIFPYPNWNGTARLLRETNMTFMKSAHSAHSQLIDDIFLALLSDEQLLSEILDYSQTQSVVKGIAAANRSCIQDDIDRYEAAGQVLEVTAGNRQLIWSYQNLIAARQLQWLHGEGDLADVLYYADENSGDSMN